jgi:hypothetical protein
MTDSEAIEYLDTWLGYHLDPNPTFDMQMSAAMQESNFTVPIWELYLTWITVFIWGELEMRLELVETEPYARDGSHPTIMLQLGWVELMFDSKVLYKFLYRKKYGETPMGLL